MRVPPMVAGRKSADQGPTRAYLILLASCALPMMVRAAEAERYEQLASRLVEQTRLQRGVVAVLGAGRSASPPR